jgi:hypothetical protein
MSDDEEEPPIILKIPEIPIKQDSQANEGCLAMTA